MKCPLRKKIVQVASATLEYELDECLQEECAWWRKEYPACCIYSIERAMWAIAAELGTIQERMPHLEQLKRP